jgi:uncharacterized protein (DUF305 family)
MKKNKNNVLIVAIVAIVAIAGLGFYAINRNDDSDMMNADNMSEMMETTSSMANMNSSTYKEYSQLKGEDYDRLFLANMIAHHQGAVDMAKLALQNAKHQELKDMANDIVTAQESEIADMKSWQSQWGYPSSSGEMMMDHSAMGMMADMDSMTEALKGLTGDAFDKKFIELMIEHHQSAIDMAISGEVNAYHAEVKQLTKAIVTAQSGEIIQMKQWQKDWGYLN